jgi:hypothetical protein
MPAASNFPTEPNYVVSQYRIQAVDPMVDLDGNGNALYESGSPIPASTPPPAAYGPNTWQYSYFYLAAVDVTVPAMGAITGGTVTAKVRRVFEKRFDNPWTYAMFYADDLELQPADVLTINGPIHTNGNLYIGTGNFTALNSVAYGGQYVNGYSPLDGQHTGTAGTPNFAANLPPAQTAPYLPFGWNLNINSTDGSASNDSYHELIERFTPTTADPTDKLANVRLYNQAGIKVLIDSSNNLSIYNASGTAVSSSSSGNDKKIYDTITSAVSKNIAFFDNRENTYVRVANVDVGVLKTAIDAGTITGFNGVIYFSDTTTHGTTVSSKIGGTGSTVNTTERGIRLVNGTNLPAGKSSSSNAAGLTVVCENPVYIQGDYNTGGTFNTTTKTYNTPSDNGTYTDPDYGTYDRKGAAVIGDAINVLSGAWSDTNSTLSTPNRVATNTTVNAALVGGIVPSGSNGTNYSGGGENFIRFLEDWNKNDNNFTYYGSMVELFASKQGTGSWTGAGNQYKAPNLRIYYDDAKFSNMATTPPGNLQIAAYLQQQRWYQVY